jgi:hypothetical protein
MDLTRIAAAKSITDDMLVYDADNRGSPLGDFDRQRPAQDLLVEALEIRREVVDHGIPRRQRLDLQQRHTPGAEILSQLHPVGVAMFILAVQLAQ